MLLAVDSGNTHLCLGLFRDDELLRDWRISTDARRTEDEYLVLLRSLFMEDGYSLSAVDGIVIGSVVPQVDHALFKMANKYLRCPNLFVNHQTYTGVDIRIDNPAEAGADRIINAVAAHHRFPGQLIVVDFGTATTFDCVSAEGAYLGGAICPGLEVSQQALCAHAAKLANVTLKRPKSVIGTNTADCLRSGVLWGYGGQVDGLTRRMKEELGGAVTVIATGGLASFISRFSESIDYVEPHLTLDGLNLIWKMNEQH